MAFCHICQGHCQICLTGSPDKAQRNPGLGGVFSSCDAEGCDHTVRVARRGMPSYPAAWHYMMIVGMLHVMIKLFPGLLMLLYLSCPAAGQLDPYQGFAPTPALSLEDLGHKVHTLQGYRGRVVLVNFWASWCAPCVIEMPGMQRLQEAMAGKPFTLLAVNVEESPGTVWKFAAKVGVQFPLLLDRDGQTASDWGIDIYPTSFLIDPQGRVQYVAYGPRKWDDPEMIKAIEAMFGTTAKKGKKGDILLFPDLTGASFKP